jgi:hypothetical protein
VFNGEICMLVVLLNHPASSPSIGFFVRKYNLTLIHTFIFSLLLRYIHPLLNLDTTMTEIDLYLYLFTIFTNISINP